MASGSWVDLSYIFSRRNSWREGAARKVSAFDLMLRLGQLDPSTPEGMYMIAILMRRGVFGESDKKEKAAKIEQQAA